MVNDQIVNEFMARVTLCSFIKCMSGTISRQELSHGKVKTTYITKDGQLRTVIRQPRTRKLSSSEIEVRHRFASIAEAVRFICEKTGIPCNTPARQFFSPIIKEMYYRLPADRDRDKDARTLCQAFCERFSVESPENNNPITGSSSSQTPSKARA